MSPSCANTGKPNDVSQRMVSLQDAIRRCFALYTPRGGDHTLALRVTVTPRGNVRTAHVLDAPTASREAIACTEDAAHEARFAAYCGDDVNIRWTYSLQQ